MGKPYISAYHRIVSYCDSSQDGGVCVNGDMVSDDGMSGYVYRSSIIVGQEILGPKSHALIERDMVADDTCFSDYHAGAMVDGEILPYLCSRVDVDACGGMSLFGEYSREDGHLHDLQLMNHGIAEDDLAIVSHSRVVIEDSLHICEKEPFYFAETIDKLYHDILSLSFNCCLTVAFKDECQSYLLS